MYTRHSIFTSCFIVAQCAGLLAQDSVSSGTPPAASPLGQVVVKIDPRIWVIHQSRNGDYWFGSNGSGAYRYDGQQVTQYTKAGGLTGDQVRGIQEDSKGNVFISATGGVAKFDGKSLTALEIVEASPTGKEWVLDPDDLWLVIEPGTMGPCLETASEN